MKRGAENYLSKDDESDDEIQEVSSGDGFKKADESVLATRRIRALPKRSLVEAPPPTANTNGTSTPEESSVTTRKFGGFAGFGTTSSSFSFTTPLSTSSSFTASPQMPQIPSVVPSSLLSGGPSLAPTASNSAKTFAAFLSDSSSKSLKPEPISDPLPQQKTLMHFSKESDGEAALKYYTSLRGLNVSFLTAISKAVEDDPFTDAIELLERYKNLRLGVQKEFDGQSLTPNDIHVSASSGTTTALTSMPTPPSTLTGFGTPNVSSLKTTSAGFVPKLAATVPSSSTSTSGFTPTPAPALPSPFTKSSAFSFGNSASPGATPAPTDLLGSSTAPQGSTSLVLSNPGEKAPPPSPFLASTKSTMSSTPFKFDSTPPVVSNSSTNPFGNPPPTSLFGTDKPSPANSFGSSLSSTLSKPSTFGTFGGFGKPGGGVGSIGNPVGFGFGSPPKTPDGDTAIVSGSSGFSFAPSSTAEKKSDDGSDENVGNSDGNAKVDEGDAASNPGLSTNNPHDEEGEGEEQEDTVHSVKLKAFRLKKPDETGGAGWVELGVGVLRLKKHKETQARRMLLRNSSTGKININFNIYSGLKPSQTKKTITFVGHDEGVSQTYSLRLQSTDQAINLKDILDKEIAFVEAKSED